MLFIDDNTAGSIERAAAPCINEKQHAFAGIQLLKLSSVLFNQRLGVFTGNEIDPADVFLLAQQHLCRFE